MEDLSVQYIAGFFDGEGSIGIYTNKTRGSSATTQLTQNKTKESLFILNFLKNKYGGSISEQKTLSGGIKYNWQLSQVGVKVFLKDLLPYLVLKKNQALVALYWLDNRPKPRRNEKGMVIRFTEEEYKMTEDIVKLLKELKRKDIDEVMENQKDLVKPLVKLRPLGVVKG